MNEFGIFQKPAQHNHFAIFNISRRLQMYENVYAKLIQQ